jgi:predicted dehydrogenase
VGGFGFQRRCWHIASAFFQYASEHTNALLADERINTIAVLTRHHLHARQVVSPLRLPASTSSAKNRWR